MEAKRYSENHAYVRQLETEISLKKERLQQEKEENARLDSEMLSTDRWHWNRDTVVKSPRIDRGNRVTTPDDSNMTGPQAPGTEWVSGRVVKTRLTSFQDEYSPKVDLDEAKEYHEELDRQATEDRDRRSAEKQQDIRTDQQVRPSTAQLGSCWYYIYSTSTIVSQSNWIRRDDVASSNQSIHVSILENHPRNVSPWRPSSILPRPLPMLERSSNFCS